MKQLFCSLQDSTISLLELPSPELPPGSILIRTHITLLSAGTERTLVEFGKSSIVDKARKHPDKIKQVIDKLNSDGIISTFESVSSKLSQPISLGYSNVGTVIEIGLGVEGFKIGDRVVSNGSHAEIVAVPANLCACIPDDVDDESALFTILASIGLQGIRLCEPTFGESFLVSGLGLIGLLTAQLLIAQGCIVYGVDPDKSKCELANKFGIIPLHLASDVEPLTWLRDATDGVGVDGALITASTSSSEPLHLAAQACRQRGRIVLIGVTGLDLRRDLFYEKELTFQVSCSYGPGRYDPNYEIEGRDYPIGFVRWTEKRNFQAVLLALSKGALRTEPLISHRFPIEHADKAYEILSKSESYTGILLQYPGSANPESRTIGLDSELVFNSGTSRPGMPILGFIGAGNYASRILIPAFAEVGASLHTLVASSGIGPVHMGRKFGFRQASTDVPALLADPSCNTIVIATRHDSHATLVQQSLAVGKHVFVEKPLCLNVEELSAIEESCTGEHLLMVGFNRRFAPLLLVLQQQLSRLNGPKSFVYTCNAGAIPAEHWTQDPSSGGGRLLGEACHFVDLLRYLAASPIEDFKLHTAADTKPCPDTFSLHLRFTDGSIGTVHYFANGSKAYPKERLEVFADGKVLCLDNYRKLKAWGIPGFRTRRLLKQDKGQVACCTAFLKAIQSGGPAPIPYSEIFEVQRLLLKAVNQ